MRSGGMSRFRLIKFGSEELWRYILAAERRRGGKMLGRNTIVIS